MACSPLEDPYPKEIWQFTIEILEQYHYHQFIYKKRKLRGDRWLFHFADKGNCHCFIICSKLKPMVKLLK